MKSQIIRFVAIGLGLIGLLIIGLLILGLLTPGGGGLKSVVGIGPEPEITKTNAYDTFIYNGGIDYSYVIEATIINKGRDGEVEVFGELWWHDDWRIKSKTVYLVKGEEKMVELIFREPEFFEDLFYETRYRYRAWAVAK